MQHLQKTGVPPSSQMLFSLLAPRPVPIPPSHSPYTLPSSVSRKSFACHSYENTRGVEVFFPFRNGERMELTRSRILQTAFQFQFDLYRVVHFEEKVAGIFQAPIDKWHVELRAPRPMIAGELRLHRHCQFVFAAVQNKNPVHLNRKRSLRRDFPFHAVRPENDVGVLPACENLFVHFLVASIVAAVPACRVDHNLTTGFAGRGVNVQCPIFKRKRSMNGVEGCAKRPAHFSLSGIDAENQFTGRKLRRGMLRQGAEHYQRQGSCHQKIEDLSQTDSRPTHPYFTPFRQSEIASRDANSCPPEMLRRFLPGARKGVQRIVRDP